MIQTLPCAHCNRTLVLPFGVSQEATIECAHCNEQFVISDMLRSSLGTWRVLADPAISSSSPENDASYPESHASSAESHASYPESQGHPPQPGSIPPDAQPIVPGSPNGHAEAADSHEIKLAPDSSESAKSGSKPKSNWSNFEPITHEQYERMKRKSRSPIWSMLQIVLGGVMAIPISLLLLWHLLDKDIGGAGPMVGKYVPWIVPEKFRPPSEAEITQGTMAKPAPRRGDSGFRSFDDVLPLPSSDSENSTHERRADDLPDSDFPDSSEPPAHGSGNNSDASVASSGDSSATMDSADVSGNSTRGKPSDIEDNSSSPDATNTNVERENEPQHPPTNIFALIQSCEQDLENWRHAVLADSDLKPLAQVLYRDFIDLAEAIDQLPEGNPVLRNVRDAMQPIGRNVKRNADVQQVVSQGAKFWCEKHSDSPHHAIALIVEIESAQEQADRWRIAPSNASELPAAVTGISVPRRLAPSLISGQRLLLLGQLNRSSESSSRAPSEESFQACYLHAL